MSRNRFHRRFLRFCRVVRMRIVLGSGILIFGLPAAGVYAGTPAPVVADAGWVQVPARFSWRAALQDEPSAPALRRVPMPMQLYETAAQSSLGDVRVVDARGRVMPYAWAPREQLYS